MYAFIHSVQVGLPRPCPQLAGNGENSGPPLSAFFKAPVTGPVWVGAEGLAGDGQGDREAHGGPHKALCVYPLEHYGYWVAQGLELPTTTAAFGENLTSGGLVETQVCVGDIFRAGEAVLQVSQPRQPCTKLARRWRSEGFARRVTESGRTGWYFRVLHEGALEAGTRLVLQDRNEPRWSVARLTQLVFGPRTEAEELRRAAACPALSPGWVRRLQTRAGA